LKDQLYLVNDSAEATSHKAESTCQLDVQSWYRRVYALCQSRLRMPADAEDAAQETFLRGFRQIEELRDEQALGAWLRRIASNVCVDFVRRRKVRETSLMDIETVASCEHREECDRENKDRNEMIRALVANLPEHLAEIILLHYYEEMTYDQMAEWLGIARSTVNERLSKARKLLRQQLALMEDAR